jgi:hypothetical protein
VLITSEASLLQCVGRLCPLLLPARNFSHLTRWNASIFLCDLRLGNDI